MPLELESGGGRRVARAPAPTTGPTRPPAPATGPGGGERPAPSGDVLSNLNQLVRQYAAVVRKQREIRDRGEPLLEQRLSPVDPVLGGGGDPLGDEAFTPLGVQFNDLEIQRLSIKQQLTDYGLTVTGNPLTADENTLANIAQRQAEKEAADARADQTSANVGATLAANAADRQQRIAETNIDAVFDLLDAEIARGDTTVAEAGVKSRAAFDKASIETRILGDFGGKNLPEGTKFFPGFEPGGVIAKLIESLSGISFGGLETGGTFGISPGSISAPITQPTSGLSVGGGQQSAIDAAISAVAGLGVPVDGRTGRIPGLAQQTAT